MGWLELLPQIDLALLGALLISALAAVATGHRGGRFRGLLGWVGTWFLYALVLVLLSRAHPWISIPFLGLLMFISMRGYFFWVPLRPKDRGAIMVAYGAIPVALYPGFTGSSATFLATVPLLLFLLFPALLVIGPPQEGFLESVGRVLLGVMIFVFCPAHLALMVRWEPSGYLELYGVLVLAADLPQRLAGRFILGRNWLGPLSGVIVSVALTAAMGIWLGPLCGIDSGDGGRAGLFVAIAVTMGRLVAEAVARDIGAGTAGGSARGALLDRAFPAVYAAPVYFHYLNHFA